MARAYARHMTVGVVHSVRCREVHRVLGTRQIGDEVWLTRDFAL